MSANKVRFSVCGGEYVISTTDTEEYVLSLAEKLDADMNSTMASSPTASVATSAILMALTYLDEMKKATAGADNMRGQIKDYLEDAAKAKLAAEEAHREVERLRREISFLKTRSSVDTMLQNATASATSNASAAQPGAPVPPTGSSRNGR